ncbi:MAG: GGDEF domain-containing protein [Negativicutes bacterium]|nr:GGDEF domain-containing protein [Negativicutes bacterium]
MSEITLILVTLSRAAFLIASIWLDYSLLTSNRPIWFQTVAFAGTWIVVYFLRGLLLPIIVDPFLVGYILSLFYLIPFALVFKETMHAKIFVFFMVSSFSLCIFVIGLYLEVLVFGRLVGGLLLTGLLLELAAIPLIRRHITPHVRNIIEVINQQNSSFTFFPILSFVLLAFYGVQRTYFLSTFIPLLLCTLVVAFSYYLIAKSIEQTKRNQQLTVTARTDSLTGLYNRRHMEQRILEEIEQFQRTGLVFALIIADIDLFKEINDRYGHDCGDFLLKSVSEDLRTSVRESDAVARWGGDEFLLLLPTTNAENAVGLAERIRAGVEKRRYGYGKEALSVTLTLGVSVIGGDGDTVDGLIKKADLIMYEGKKAGRNCVVLAGSIAVKEMPDS